MKNTAKTVLAVSLMSLLGFGAVSQSSMAAAPRKDAGMTLKTTPKVQAIKTKYTKPKQKIHHKAHQKSQHSPKVKMGLKAVPLKQVNTKKETSSK